jgi:hypothetical protein
MNTYHTTNECTCRDYDIETGEDTPSVDCYGDCWESELQFWASETAPLFEALNDESEWRIDGLPLWNRNLTGTVCTNKPEELLRAVTVRGSWNLTWSVDIENLRLNLSLSHHDVPMGRSFTAEVVR